LSCVRGESKGVTRAGEGEREHTVCADEEGMMGGVEGGDWGRKST
jgi:hypothetical protein